MRLVSRALQTFIPVITLSVSDGELPPPLFTAINVNL